MVAAVDDVLAAVDGLNLYARPQDAVVAAFCSQLRECLHPLLAGTRLYRSVDTNFGEHTFPALG